MKLFRFLRQRPLRWLAAGLASGLLMLVAGCGGGQDPILGSPGATTPPTVTATTPLSSTPPVSGVAPASTVTATFSKPMSAASLTGASFSLACPAGTPVAATVSYDAPSRTATLTPAAALPPLTLCVATVTTAAQDSDGLGLAAAYTWSFITAALPDTTRPTVEVSVPADGAAGVAVNTTITATFSEDMAPATLTGTSFSVRNTTLGTPVAGTVTYVAAARTVTFTPADGATLANDTLFTATITTAATDLAGNALAGNTGVAPAASNFVWSFTTSQLPDTTRPTVEISVPAPAATGVAVNSAITATFSEPMAPASLNGSSFTLRNTTLGTAVTGSVSYVAASRTVTFTPTAPATLANNTLYTATITTAATDLAGNALAGSAAALPAASNYVWSFTTSALADTVRPTVTLSVPIAGATAVPTNTAISATFSEPMNPATISSTSFTVRNTTLGTAVAGTVSYVSASRTATFTPSTPGTLANNTQYTATITTAATDLAGNALAGTAAALPAASNFVWSFTTALLADTTRPTVTGNVPSAGATGVATNTQITATFSEDMAPASLSGTSFTLRNTTLGTAVAGVVAYVPASRTVSFTPSGPATLANNSGYTATLTTAVTDLAGNGLAGSAAALPAASDYVWSFTTAALGDIVPPTVTAVSPIAGAVNVCLTHPVSATFSEPMDAASIDGTTLTVKDGDFQIPGSVSYDAIARIATFVPTSPSGFPPSRLLMATVRSGVNGVKDLAGNAMVADRVWSFTTGTQACLAPIDLKSAAAFGAFGGAAGVTNQGTQTTIQGNLGTTAACTLMTGLHDAANVYTETPLNVGAVNGSILCGPPAPGTTVTLAAATQARADALAAFNTMAALPAGSDPGAGQLGGLVLTSAVYTAAGGTFAITSGDLTLDAQGDASAVWVFQSASALTVGLPAVPRRVTLINGAQAKNVFWKVGSAARIEDGSSMVGTVIAPAGVTLSTAGQTVQTVLIGRALGLTASVTMVNTTIVAP